MSSHNQGRHTLPTLGSMQDHKPDTPGEASRIRQAGGRTHFTNCWRVIIEPKDGLLGSGLAVSRSFGDLDFKEPLRWSCCQQLQHV